MRRFVEGVDRGQTTLFPECLEDWIGEDNPVRVIDAFVEELDLAELGFDGVDPEATGRPSYHPSVLLASSPRLPAVAYCQGTLLRNEIEAREAGKLEAATDYVASAIAEKHGCGEVPAKIQAHVIVAVV